MSIEIKVALIAAIVALITSLISAYFSYVNSKSQSKAKKDDSYSEFLRSKICRLEKDLEKLEDDVKLNKEGLESMALSILNLFEKRGKILVHNSHYLSEKTLTPLMEKRELIMKSIAINRAKNNYGEEIIKKDVGKLMPSEEILNEVLNFNEQSEKLIRNELKMAVKKLEEIFK